MATKPARLILVGMMGSGKTTVGRLLAEATGWAYLDNDQLVGRATGRTARELADATEAELRRAESQALLAGLALPAPSVVSTAAGTILDSRNRAAIIGAGVVIWLRARPETLARRAVGGRHRPWLGGDPVLWISTTDAARRQLYLSVADLALDVDDLSPGDVVARILHEPTVMGLREQVT